MSSTRLPAVVTVFHGANRLEIRERIDASRLAIDPDGLSTSVFDPAHAQLADVATAVGSPGFFGSGRLVICYNLLIQAGGRRSRKKSDEKADGELAFLAHPAPGVSIVIVEDSLGKAEERNLRQLTSDVAIENLEVPRGRALIEWTTGRARRHRSTIDGAVATRLVEALYPGSWRQKSYRDDIPPDLYRLDAELAKLAVAAGDQREISAEMVTELVPEADALDIWGLSNALADHDRERAIRHLEQALANGQAPEMILAQISAQLETFAVLVAAKGQSPQSVSARSGLSEGRLKQASRAVRNYGRSDLQRALSELRQVDFGIKQGHFEPEDALVRLVTALSTPT